jgi:hypothetical protein
LREVRAAAEVEVAADGVTVMMTVSEVWPMMVVVWEDSAWACGGSWSVGGNSDGRGGC